MLREFFNSRLLALMRKEFNQIRRDTRIVMSLIVPLALLLLVFGLVLNSKIENVRLGVIDQSGTSESRELVADLSVSRSFRLTRAFLSPGDLSDAVMDGRVQAGLIIPAEFGRDLEKGRQATVQFVLNAMDANTATVAKTYAQGVVSAYAKSVRGPGVHARFDEVAGAVARPGGVELQPSFLYNPGLFAAWFTVTGVVGLLCILNGTLVASSALVKEREAGTIEQLLMSPATTTEIIVAKIAPLFAALCVMVVILVVGIGRVVFGVPLKGSGLETLWPNFLALALIALALLTLSIMRFRKQLA